MSNKIETVKRALYDSIAQLCEVSWMFCKNPGRDFTRNNKLPLHRLIPFLLSMEGGTLTTDMLSYFGCSADTASASALVQQRAKINSHMFPSLFDLFVQKTASDMRYKGLRLLAADGSEIQIPQNPEDADSYYPGSNGQAPYNLLHLSAAFDLLQHTYTDAQLLGKKQANERKTLCKMVDRSSIDRALLIADRGFENYNLMAHIQEKGWFYLIRIQDVINSRGIAAGLDLPLTEEFDLFVDMSLTTKQTNQVKLLLKNRNQYKCIHKDFDYLPETNKKHEPAQFYSLPFRIVRFRISDDSFETVVTNLDAETFPPHELKRLYNMRWGIETSFRELKYTIGLLHFHAKKVEYIYQEVFARLIMYNFSELITSSVVIQKSNCLYAYKANFTVAVHVCRQFLAGNVSPPDVEAIIRRHVSPIRPGRSRPRIFSAYHTVSFTYRVA